ncbi:MAG: hypothetical protein IPJ41_07055 [Phycisphaerales bacterium]|nr:hypothetical protein [Phycisphaerales bacterium]
MRMAIAVTAAWVGSWAGLCAAQGQPDDIPAARVSSPEDDAMRRLLMDGARGSLAIQVVQGTKGGAPVNSGEVQVDLYHDTDHPIWEFSTGLERGGVAMVGDLPVAIAVRALVRMEYGGVTYLEVGPPMGPDAPDGVVKVLVYETTPDEPAWKVAMRHLTVTRTGTGTQVDETLVVENPTDRTWQGAEPDARGQRTCVRVRLPEGAQDVTLVQGFHGWCCTEFEEGQLAVGMPMMPGQTTFAYSYLLPETRDQLSVRFRSPVPTDHVVVFVPDDGSEAQASGLDLAGRDTVQGARMRIFQGASLGPDSEAGVVLTTALRSPSPVGDSSRRGAGRTLMIAGARSWRWASGCLCS